MRNLAENWPEIPAWQTVTLRKADIVIATIAGLRQHLVSGRLAAFAAEERVHSEGEGALSVLSSGKAALRLARDRMLVINADTEATRPGWHDEGFAVSDVSAAFHVFEISGAGIGALLTQALFIDSDKAGPSASVVFAGTAAVLYYADDKSHLRLHVERGFAAYVWNWLEAYDG
jgi:heterotetrameric sarcosine oxidase gamma subunit